MNSRLSFSAVALLALTALAALLLTIGGPTSPAQAQTDTPARTITVMGEGQVSAPPDMALVYIGVEVGDPDVKKATDQAAKQMQTVLTALTGEGVAAKDIQTSYYSLYVDRPYTPDGQPGEPVYRVSNTMQVTIRDLDNITETLSAAIEAGANSINSVEFRLADPSALRSEARAKAVTDAEARAAELAKLNGVAVGQVVKVTDSGYYGSEPSYANSKTAVDSAGPIAPGQINVNAQLEIVYEILQ